MKSVLGWVILLTSAGAAGIGVRAAVVHVRDNLDGFVADIRRQSFWATWAAATAAVSVFLQAIERLF